MDVKCAVSAGFDEVEVLFSMDTSEIQAILLRGLRNTSSENLLPLHSTIYFLPVHLNFHLDTESGFAILLEK